MIKDLLDGINYASDNITKLVAHLKEVEVGRDEYIKTLDALCKTITLIGEGSQLINALVEASNIKKEEEK